MHNYLGLSLWPFYTMCAHSSARWELEWMIFAVVAVIAVVVVGAGLASRMHICAHFVPMSNEHVSNRSFFLYTFIQIWLLLGWWWCYCFSVAAYQIERAMYRNWGDEGEIKIQFETSSSFDKLAVQTFFVCVCICITFTGAMQTCST